jgi:hypothetical protein
MAGATCPRCGRRAIQKYRCLNCGYMEGGPYGGYGGNDVSAFGDSSCGGLIALIVVAIILSVIVSKCSNLDERASSVPSSSASSAPSASSDAR